MRSLHLISNTNTVECRYNAVQYNKILHTSLQWRGQNINKRLNLQKTHHTSPYRASYGVSFVRIFDKIDRVITAPHCTWDASLWTHHPWNYNHMKTLLWSWCDYLSHIRSQTSMAKCIETPSQGPWSYTVPTLLLCVSGSTGDEWWTIAACGEKSGSKVPGEDAE